MLGNFLKIYYILVCFLKPLNSTCFIMGNDGLSSNLVYSAAGLDPTCLHKHNVSSSTEMVKESSVIIPVTHYLTQPH